MLASGQQVHPGTPFAPSEVALVLDPKAIAVAGDFPDPDTIGPGRAFLISADVTDNDATKTNTGLSFLAGDFIAWTGSSWRSCGGLFATQQPTFAWTGTAGGNIPAYGAVVASDAGVLTAGSWGSRRFVGVETSGGARTAAQSLALGIGRRRVKISAPTNAGRKLKLAANGRVSHHTSTTSDIATILSGAGLGFTNQPANDGVTVVSSSAGDTGSVTIIGTTNGGHTIVTEVIVLNGTTPVNSVKVDWGVIVAIKLSAAQVGTVTVKETSGGATIKALAPGATSSGVLTPAAGSQYAFGSPGSVVADAGTTKEIAVKYIQANDETTSTITSVALNGATAVAVDSTNGIYTVTEVYVGDVETARTVTVKNAATVDDPSLVVGTSHTQGAAVGDTIFARL